jgi:hypothetical protein
VAERRSYSDQGEAKNTGHPAVTSCGVVMLGIRPGWPSALVLLLAIVGVAVVVSQNFPVERSAYDSFMRDKLGRIDGLPIDIGISAMWRARIAIVGTGYVAAMYRAAPTSFGAGLPDSK